VDVSQIASGRLAGPLAADHGSHGLQIGMARGYDRDAKALAGIERRPRESIRVTHLDDGRPELFQAFGACASLPAEAIAATAGHRDRRQPVDLPRIEARNCDAVAPRRTPRNPATLRPQVALDTATLGAPEHRYVEQVSRHSRSPRIRVLATHVASEM